MLGKKGVYLLIILISSIILASCVGYIEISQLAIVTVTGIDLDRNKSISYCYCHRYRPRG